MPALTRQEGRMTGPRSSSKIAYAPLASVRRIAFTAVAWSAIGSSLLAQSNLNQGITGQVADGAGSVIAKAKITAVDQNTGYTRSALTNESGNYAMPEMPVGTYRI